MSTSFFVILWMFLQLNCQVHGKSIADHGDSETPFTVQDSNSTDRIENKSTEEQPGVEFCGYVKGWDLFDTGSDSSSEDILPNNQTHRRTRRFLSDFFGVRYRLKKWNKNIITWRLSNRNLRQLNYDQVKEILVKAFKTWSDVVPLTFREMNSSYADIQISFESGDHNCEDTFDGTGNKLAHAYGPGSGILGDIHFDADENWILSTDHSTFNWIFFRRPSFLNVAIHEIGHALGLYHSETKESIMYGKYNQVESLHKTDREAIQKLYPTKTKADRTNSGRTFITTATVRRCTFCEYAFCGCRQYCDICFLSTRGHRILIL